MSLYHRLLYASQAHAHTFAVYPALHSAVDPTTSCKAAFSTADIAEGGKTDMHDVPSDGTDKDSMGLTMGLAVSMMCLHSCSVKKEWYRKARGCQDRASTLEACSQEFGCAFQCMVRLMQPLRHLPLPASTMRPMSGTGLTSWCFLLLCVPPSQLLLPGECPRAQTAWRRLACRQTMCACRCSPGRAHVD